jgi:hypothetical protein
MDKGPHARPFGEGRERMAWRRSDDWVGSQIEDSFVMLDIRSGQYVSMNATAADIWHALEEPRSEEEVAALMLDRYEVDADHCLSAVRSVLANMAEKRLVNPA